MKSTKTTKNNSDDKQTKSNRKEPLDINTKRKWILETYKNNLRNKIVKRNGTTKGEKRISRCATMLKIVIALVCKYRQTEPIHPNLDWRLNNEFNSHRSNKQTNGQTHVSTNKICHFFLPNETEKHWSLLFILVQNRWTFYDHALNRKLAKEYKCIKSV